MKKKKTNQFGTESHHTREKTGDSFYEIAKGNYLYEKTVSNFKEAEEYVNNFIEKLEC